MNLPARLAEASIYGVLFLLPLSFWPYSYEMFGAPKALILRGLTTLALVSWASGVVASRRSCLYLGSFFLPVGLFLVVSLASTLASVAPRISWLGEHYRMDGLLALINFIVLFFVATQVLRSRSQLERATLAAIVGAFPVGLIGILQGYGLDIPILGVFGSGRRASSTQGNPDFLGAYLVLMWPLAAAWVLRARTKAGTVASGAILTVLLTALALSYTRGAWIGGVAGGLALVALARQRPGRWARVAAPVACALLLAWLPQLSGANVARTESHGSSPGIEAAGGPTVGDTLASMTNPAAGTAQVRLWLWETSLALIMENPVLGTGPNSFVSVAGRYLPKDYITGPEKARFPDKPHNQYLELAVSSGLLGLGVYLWMLFAFGCSAFRWIRDHPSSPLRLIVVGLLASWFGFLVQDFFLFPVLDSGALFWVFMALALSPVGPRARPLRLRLRLPAAGRVAAAGGLALAGALALWLVWRPFAADLHLRDAEQAMGEGHQVAGIDLHYEKALHMDSGDEVLLLRFALARTMEARLATSPSRRQEAARGADVLLSRAVELDPRLALLYLRRGEARELQGGRDLEALADYRRAVELYPYYPEANIALVTLFHRLGNPEEAILAEKRLLEVRPQDPDLLFNLGLDYAATRSWGQALAAWQEAARLSPADASVRYRLGTAYEGQGDLGRAREAYGQALSLDPSGQPAQEALQRLAGQP